MKIFEILSPSEVAPYKATTIRDLPSNDKEMSDFGSAPASIKPVHPSAKHPKLASKIWSDIGSITTKLSSILDTAQYPIVLTQQGVLVVPPPLFARKRHGAKYFPTGETDNVLDAVCDLADKYSLAIVIRGLDPSLIAENLMLVLKSRNFQFYAGRSSNLRNLITLIRPDNMGVVSKHTPLH